MYDVTTFEKGEEDVYKLLRLNRALEQATESKYIWEEPRRVFQCSGHDVFKGEKRGLRKGGYTQVSMTCIARPRAVDFPLQARS